MLKFELRMVSQRMLSWCDTESWARSELQAPTKTRFTKSESEFRNMENTANTCQSSETDLNLILTALVKDIYDGLIIIEAECIKERAALARTACLEHQSIRNEWWADLLALHRNLLHDYYDYVMASQHPLGNTSLRRLVSENTIPQRMWYHGIYSFLELLKYYLPASREHILTFTYYSYALIALLYEVVPVFQNSWLDMLVDLTYYIIDIEDNNTQEREVWKEVACYWYSKRKFIRIS